MSSTLEELRQALLNDHWRHRYNWKGVSPVKLAQMHGCSANEVRSLMFAIQEEHPRPKHKRKDTCKYCGAEIVWIGKHPCDPPVLKGVAADGKVHSFRQSHFASCPRANQARRENIRKL